MPAPSYETSRRMFSESASKDSSGRRLKKRWNGCEMPPGSTGKDMPRRSTNICSLVYVGSSMYPTFRAPEIVYFEPYGNRSVRRGDVVVFNDPARGSSIIHRVISVTPAGIKTRGDNNDRPDSWTLRKADLDGRVAFARRDKRYRCIRGGLYGLMSMTVGRTLGRLAHSGRSLLSEIYPQVSGR